MIDWIIQVIGGNFEMGERGKGKKGGERNAHVRTKKGPLGENGYDPAINEIENEFPEEPWALTLQLVELNRQRDLDWGEIENFGTGSEVGRFLQNNDDTQCYGYLQTETDVDVFKIFAKERSSRGRNAKQRSFRQFIKKLTVSLKA